MVVKVYPLRYEKTHLCASFERRRARDPGGGIALAGCLHLAPLADTSGQLSGRERLPDRPRAGMQPANRPQRHPRLQRGGSPAGASARLQTSAHRSQGLRDPERAEALRELLHHTPRRFGKDTSLWWTLDLAAEVSFEEGLTEERITGETVRTRLARMGVRWERAKRWIASPDPEYARKRRRHRRRHRLIRLAEARPEWVAGFLDFLDESWFSRLARPALNSWSEAGEPCASSNDRSRKTIPIRRPSPATGFMCPSWRMCGYVSRMAAP